MTKKGMVTDRGSGADTLVGPPSSLSAPLMCSRMSSSRFGAPRAAPNFLRGHWGTLAHASVPRLRVDPVRSLNFPAGPLSGLEARPRAVFSALGRAHLPLSGRGPQLSWKYAGSVCPLSSSTNSV